MKNIKKVIANFEKAYRDVMTVLGPLPKKEFDYKDIDTFEDAIEMVEDSQTEIGDNLIEEYNKVKTIFPEGTYYNALAKVRILVFAANGCDESFPDWKNGNQEKRHPYYYMDKPGVGFSFDVTLYGGSNAIVGSRLEYKDAERCQHFCTHKNFQPSYEIIFNQ